MSSEAPTSTRAYPTGQLAQVCGEVAAVFKNAWGRGPVEAAAHWAGSDMLVLLLHNGHTEAEKTLRAAGHIQELLGGRHLLEVLIEDDLKACVERVIGRRVATVLSATRLDPDLSAEIFLLGDPLNESGDSDAAPVTEPEAAAHGSPSERT